MAQILAVCFASVLLWFGYRWFRREYERVDNALRRAQRRINRRDAEQSAQALRLDPVTGYYQPAKGA
jgi:uncharacterized membrane protein